MGAAEGRGENMCCRLVVSRLIEIARTRRHVAESGAHQNV